MRRIAATAGLLLALAGTLLAFAPAASAHSVLLSSTPAAGQTLDAAPTSVVLTFNEPIQASTMQVAVTAASGTAVSSGEPTVRGAVITIPLLTNLPNDDYTVAYQVVSVDGHPVREALSFTVNDPTSTRQPLTGDDDPYDVRPSDQQAQGGTALYAKVLYVVLPLIILGMVVGIIRTRGRYRERNPKDQDEGLSNPFVLRRVDDRPRRDAPTEHIHTRPDITRDREP